MRWRWMCAVAEEETRGEGRGGGLCASEGRIALHHTPSYPNRMRRRAFGGRPGSGVCGEGGGSWVGAIGPGPG